MIDPKELRIRNWVTIDNPIAWPEMANIPVMVTSVEESLDEQFPESPGAIRLKYEHDTYCQYSEFISPIPLTHEWLERLGFKYTDTPDDDYSKNGITIYGSPFEDYWRVEQINHIGMGQKPPKIKYVHQLQNLFFALTGEEL